jgi:hypothetical protein
VKRGIIKLHSSTYNEKDLRMSNGIVISTTGEVTEFVDEFSLSSIYAALDIDTFSVVSLMNDVKTYLDDEGLLKAANPNLIGSAVFAALGYPMDRYPTGAIHGNILFFGGVDDAGYELSLDDSQRELILDIVADYKATH